MNTTHEHDERFSAFLDGELSDQQARQAIRQLGEDRESRQRYAEYCTIGDLLRGHHHDMPDLTDRVMAALDTEPTILAPVKKPVQRRPLLWAAAAATAAITWALWSAAPQEQAGVPLAAATLPAQAEIAPYLVAHQDYAQAMDAPTDLRITRVSYDGAGR